MSLGRNASFYTDFRLQIPEMIRLIRNPNFQISLLAVLYLLLALNGLSQKHIVEDDEAREIAIVREIVDGKVLFPLFNETLIPDKPILSHWAAAVPTAILGFSETSVRISSALAGTAVVLP